MAHKNGGWRTLAGKHPVRQTGENKAIGGGDLRQDKREQQVKMVGGEGVQARTQSCNWQTGKNSRWQIRPVENMGG